jgi:predicted O-methyltransferase YrrM
LESTFREELVKFPNVDLRHKSFAEDGSALRGEPPFDFIFVDGSHRYDMALADSWLALEIVAPGGVIVWHDYRLSGFATEELSVPEVLRVVANSCPVFAVEGTTCAVHLKPLA